MFRKADPDHMLSRGTTYVRIFGAGRKAQLQNRRVGFVFRGPMFGAQCRGPVSDFVFGFSADPGHDLLEIIRKSRVASQARHRDRDGVRLCFWFLRAVLETKNKV